MVKVYNSHSGIYETVGTLQVRTNIAEDKYCFSWIPNGAECIGGTPDITLHFSDFMQLKQFQEVMNQYVDRIEEQAELKMRRNIDFYREG